MRPLWTHTKFGGFPWEPIPTGDLPPWRRMLVFEGPVVKHVSRGYLVI